MADLMQPLIVAIFIGASTSLLGAFVILRKMALAGDALSHVALPGLALGLMFNFNPFWGAAAFLLIATLGVWFLEYYTTLSVDTLIGVFFTVSLAIGVLITPQQELLEALFGNISLLSRQEALFSIFVSALVIITLLVVYKKLALNMLSQELAQSIGIKNRILELVYLFIFALAVALGIRFVGALLMGSLVIIPAASAKNIAKSLKSFMIISVSLGILTTMLGIIFAFGSKTAPGPLFILISAGFFVITLIIRRFRFALK